jgi:hypothetical protein
VSPFFSKSIAVTGHYIKSSFGFWARVVLWQNKTRKVDRQWHRQTAAHSVGKKAG